MNYDYEIEKRYHPENFSESSEDNEVEVELTESEEIEND